MYAVDVGRGQLHWNLQKDERVIRRDGINVRYLDLEEIGEKPDLITVDLSFISLRLVLPGLTRVSPATIVALVKPQFEAWRSEVEPGGLITDDALRTRVIERLRDGLREAGGRSSGRYAFVDRRAERQSGAFLPVPCLMSKRGLVERLSQSLQGQIQGVDLVCRERAQVFQQVFTGNLQTVPDRLILAHFSQRRRRCDRGHTACCTKPAAGHLFVLHSQFKAGQIPAHGVFTATPVCGFCQLPAITQLSYELPDPL